MAPPRQVIAYLISVVTIGTNRPVEKFKVYATVAINIWYLILNGQVGAYSVEMMKDI